MRNLFERSGRTPVVWTSALFAIGLGQKDGLTAG
jgi:hypothetical protein